MMWFLKDTIFGQNRKRFQFGNFTGIENVLCIYMACEDNKWKFSYSPVLAFWQYNDLILAKLENLVQAVHEAKNRDTVRLI